MRKSASEMRKLFLICNLFIIFFRIFFPFFHFTEDKMHDLFIDALNLNVQSDNNPNCLRSSMVQVKQN